MSGYFTYIIFNFYSNPVRWVLLLPFYRCGEWGLEKRSDLPKRYSQQVTQTSKFPKPALCRLHWTGFCLPVSSFTGEGKTQSVFLLPHVRLQWIWESYHVTFKFHLLQAKSPQVFVKSYVTVSGHLSILASLFWTPCWLMSSWCVVLCIPDSELEAFWLSLCSTLSLFIMSTGFACRLSWVQILTLPNTLAV